MGLDIFFYKARKASACAYLKTREELEQLYKEGAESEEQTDKLQDELDNTYPFEELAYFRKVNLLMEYFDYEGNCDYQEISKGEVEDLVENCKEVLENHSKAEELLPTQGGFFFGSTDYNEWYFKDLEEVRDKFTEILATTDFNTDTLYMYAWW